MDLLKKFEESIFPLFSIRFDEQNSFFQTLSDSTLLRLKTHIIKKKMR